MGSINFFKTEADAVWGGPSAVFDTDLMDAIARGQADLADDLHVAQALARLVHDELRSFGTGENNSLTDEQMAKALRALRSVLRRLDIDFQPPFRDFTGFRDHWSRQGMSGGGGYAARRGYLHELFEPVWTALDDAEVEATSDAICGVDGELKNIIFASSGPKPEIILRDAISNIIEIVKYEESCLVYDRPLTESGLTWGELVSWWGDRRGHRKEQLPNMDAAHELYARLMASLADNPAEKLLFRTYCERFGAESGFAAPALLPQVYLHFDPLTKKQRAVIGLPDRLDRERMDFLLLLPNHVRIVIEVDGKQHYADGDTASPKLYSEMVAEDRALRLRGYEVFRFGGYELGQAGAAHKLREFFDRLLMIHGIIE